MESRVLQSKTFAGSVLTQIKDLYDRNQLCDYFLNTSTEEFHVHRILLCAVSNFFRALLCTGSMQETHFQIDAFDADCVQTVIHFMYTGDLVLSKTNIWNVLAISSQFEMPDVADLCQEFLKELTKPRGSHVAHTYLGSPSLQDTSRVVTASAEESRANWQASRSRSVSARTVVKVPVKVEPLDGFLEDALLVEVKSDFADLEADDDFINGEECGRIPSLPSSVASDVDNLVPSCSGRTRRKEDTDRQVAQLSVARKRGRSSEGRSSDVSDGISACAANQGGKRGRKKTKIAGNSVETQSKQQCCTLCGARFVHTSALHMHKQSHLTVGYALMKYRHSVRWSVKVLQQKMMNGRLTFSSKGFYCARCKKSWKTHHRFAAHKIKSHSNDMNPHECLKCQPPRCFSSMKHLYVHSFNSHMFHRRVSLKKRLHKCHWCGRRFLYRLSLTRHRESSHSEILHGRSLAPKSCWRCKEPKCKFIGKTQISYMKHMVREHPLVTFDTKVPKRF